jgi:hypothetical protein
MRKAYVIIHPFWTIARFPRWWKDTTFKFALWLLKGNFVSWWEWITR